MDQAGATKEQTDLGMASDTPDGSSALPAVATVWPGEKLVTDHELVRRIGRGSYGEVWLARNVIGTYRAVKIVFRAQFENEQPYEREFKGIQRFEPVSRSHEGFVDILQIGRNDQLGCFYYVMELADDDKAERSDGKARVDQLGAPVTQKLGFTGAQHSDSPPLHDSFSSYIPKTLRSELRRRGRLPVEECVSIGLILTSALECLHKGGLVHRDIKPSNIIFVKGVPKLADIGLVADVSEAKSFVGTAGFIPPEGPGAPSADLYSLGKVFYEMSTGRDRQDFPQLPADLREFPHPEALVEFNEILLKACESEPSSRYQSSAEMRADLELMQAGKSVRRKRAVQQGLAACKKARLAAGLLALVTLGAILGVRAHGDRELRSKNPEVNKLVDHGSYCALSQTPEQVAQALIDFKRAVELDPKSIPAYFGLFRVYKVQGEPPSTLSEIAGKLKELDSSGVESHAASSWIKWTQWQFTNAMAEGRLATKLHGSKQGLGSAHTQLGYFLLMTGNATNALKEFQLAEQLLRPTRAFSTCLDILFSRWANMTRPLNTTSSLSVWSHGTSPATT